MKIYIKLHKSILLSCGLQFGQNTPISVIVPIGGSIANT